MFTTPESRRLSFTIPEMVQLTFRIYRDNIVPLLILSTLILIGFAVFNQVFLSGAGLTALTQTGSAGVPNSAQVRAAFQALIPAFILLLIVSPILALLQYVLVNGPITWLVSEYVLGNRGVGFRGMFSGASSRLGSLTGGYFIYLVIAVITFIGVAFLGALCAPVLLAFIPLMYLFICINFVLAPVLILERIDFTAALNRAWVLGKSNFWRGMGLYFLLGLVTLVISLPTLIVSWPEIMATAQAGAAGSGRFQPVQTTLLQSPLSLIVSTVTSILILPLAPVASTLFYYDIRSRTEGLEMALEALDRPDARPNMLPSPMQGSGFTSQDFLNMLLLIGLFVVLMMILFIVAFSLFSQFGNALPTGFFDRV
jgi:hypothetical protein